MDTNKNILNEIGNSNPFTVPPNYFENFAANIEKQVLQQKKETKIIPLYQKLKPVFYIAAVVVLAFFVSDYFLLKSEANERALLAAESNYTVLEHSDMLLSYIDEGILIDFLVEQEIPVKEIMN